MVQNQKKFQKRKKQGSSWKKILGLKDLKQKSIEGFLHISREDQYSGGQLIEVYQEYLKTREQSLLSLLLLHNEDDLKGMPALLPVLSYPDFFSQDFSLCEICPPAEDKPVFQLEAADLSGLQQFFIVHEDSPHLNGAYASFGYVIAGMDVVDAIANTKTDFRDKPVSEQKMKKVTAETFGVEYPEPETV